MLYWKNNSILGRRVVKVCNRQDRCVRRKGREVRRTSISCQAQKEREIDPEEWPLGKGCGRLRLEDQKGKDAIKKGI